MRWMTLFLLAIFGVSASLAEAQTKRAFIVAVGEYAELSDLQKTIGDASGYSEVFGQHLGFEVTQLTDPDTDSFFEAFDTFVDKIQPID